MISALLAVIPLIPCVVNVSVSMWIAWCFRRHPKPPMWSIFCLLIFGIGTLRLISIAGVSSFSIVVMTVVTAILCIVQSLALSCQRWLRSSRRMSWSIATMVVLPLVVWTDLRFRIVVTEVDGTPVEVDAKTINFHRPPRSYLQSFGYGYGNRLKEGVVYFGFCQWVMFRGDWVIFGTVGDPHGSYTHFNISNPDWNKWPVRLTVKAP